MTYMLGVVSSIYSTDIVMQALLITTGVTLALTIFTMQSGIDFSFMGGFLLASLGIMCTQTRLVIYIYIYIYISSNILSINSPRPHLIYIYIHIYIISILVHIILYLVGLILFGFLRFFLPYSPIMNTIYSVIGALIFSLYIVYDTFQIIEKLSPGTYSHKTFFLFLSLFLSDLFISLYI